ncbi:hypothetical protein CPB83DRAFT_896248 [Crepidotus variabilis]|uniref:Uncharacterized protein n=1 Tax=Crepidotus variabilis TaxID=179855 RepID=A0A9P6JN25_9AGAR|nr:hypothetical protein CPB83DRAFT_896248 [Crepidotus variabilis]
MQFQPPLLALNYEGLGFILIPKSEVIRNELRHTTTSDERNRLQRGDQIILDGHDLEHTYELTGIRYQNDQYSHIEMVAFNHAGDYYAEASSVMVPFLIQIETTLLHSNFYFSPRRIESVMSIKSILHHIQQGAQKIGL